VVLYEMLTGTRAFRRESSADTMAAILNDQPREVMAVRPDVSAAVDRIVQHCLEKNPVERFHSARDVAFALESLSGSAPALGGVAARTVGRLRERLAWAALSTALAIALAWLLMANRTPPLPPLPVSRTLLVLPDGSTVNELAPPGSRLALSPDGTRLVFEGRHASTSATQLFLLPLDGTAGGALPGTEAAISPFWSPDGSQIMLSRDGNLLRMSLDGTSPVPVTKSVGFITPGSWGPDRVALVGGLILHAVQIHDGATSIVRNSANNVRYDFPQFLPDGKRYLFGTLASSGEVSISTGRIGSSDSEVLIKGLDIGKGVYAGGALLYTRGDTLFAQRAEGDPLKLTGDPIRIASQVLTSSTRGGAFSVSTNGVLVYQPIRRENVRLTFLDRKGQPLSTIGDDGDYTNVELSNDGRKALVSMTDPRLQTRDIFIVDLDRGVRQRFTIDPSDERSAIWSADSRHVLYTSKGLNLYARAADSSSDERGVIMDGASKDPYDWSSDGRLVLYRRSGADTGNDIWIGPSDGSGPGRALAATRFSEVPGNFSPDGRFLVYSSDESGQREVYLMKVDGGGKTQISASGGFYPLWRGDGREIVYLTTDRTMMGAAVQQVGDRMTVSAPRPIFKVNVGTTLGRNYDVTPDGTRFLMAIPVPSRIPQAFTVISNWPRLLEKD
jgi:Tol biopolymer transport system component